MIVYNLILRKNVTFRMSDESVRKIRPSRWKEKRLDWTIQNTMGMRKSTFAKQEGILKRVTRKTRKTIYRFCKCDKSAIWAHIWTRMLHKMVSMYHLYQTLEHMPSSRSHRHSTVCHTTQDWISISSRNLSSTRTPTECRHHKHTPHVPSPVHYGWPQGLKCHLHA